MSRRRRAIRRSVPPDYRYGRESLSRFINRLMMRGKKSLATRIVYAALGIIEKQERRSPLDVFDLAVRNSTPLLRVRPRRVGGATYQVPVEVPPVRGTTIAMRWLIQAARARKGQPMEKRLAAELLDAARGQGGAARRREEMHRMAEANRAFVHYRY